MEIDFKGAFFLPQNYKRVAEVWLDEFKEYFYKKKPHALELDAGDLSAQFALRKRLQCKSFKWFMENVAFDLLQYIEEADAEERQKSKIAENNGI